ncbi:MAG: translation initiation factor IF-3 [bacterium]|nr:translation initiation factor IF-3 [bacterium]
MQKRIRINNQITAPEVRVIGETGQQIGVMSVGEALRLAREKGLDLIEIVPTANPPVSKMMDFGKFRYQVEKEARHQRAKQRRDEMKTVRISVRAGRHDIGFRAKQVEGFLNEGLKAHLEVTMKGREKAHPELARQKLNEFLDMIAVSKKFLQEIKRTPAGFTTVIIKQ